METVLKLLEDAFNQIQSVDIKATLNNVTALQTGLGEIRAAHKIVREIIESEVKKNAVGDMAENGSEETAEGGKP